MPARIPVVDFVGFPLHKRAFYTHPDPARPQLSNSFDLLFRGLELVTGGQRLHTTPPIATCCVNET
jgi:aspartyl/asparaginyl-tRNA synthetase